MAASRTQQRDRRFPLSARTGLVPMPWGHLSPLHYPKVQALPLIFEARVSARARLVLEWTPLQHYWRQMRANLADASTTMTKSFSKSDKSSLMCLLVLGQGESSVGFHHRSERCRSRAQVVEEHLKKKKTRETHRGLEFRWVYKLGMYSKRCWQSHS